MSVQFSRRLLIAAAMALLPAIGIGQASANESIRVGIMSAEDEEVWAVVSKEAAPRPQIAQERVEKPRAAARTRLARRHSNPLDAQARDTRIQKWPCTSGGICDWQR